VPPEEADQWFEYWVTERFAWYLSLGIPESQLRLRHHQADELSHYSAATADVEFLFPGAGTSWRASPTAPTST